MIQVKSERRDLIGILPKAPRMALLEKLITSLAKHDGSKLRIKSFTTK